MSEGSLVGKEAFFFAESQVVIALSVVLAFVWGRARGAATRLIPNANALGYNYPPPWTYSCRVLGAESMQYSLKSKF